MFVRLSYSYDQLSRLWERMLPKCDKLIVYEHSEQVSRVHVHFYCKFNASSDTLRNYIRSSLGVVSLPRTDWSFKEKDVDEGCITYMSKGHLEPKLVKGYTEEEVKNLRLMWVDYSEIKKDHKVGLQKVPTRFQIAEEVHKNVIDKFPDFENMSCPEIYLHYVTESKRLMLKYRQTFTARSIMYVSDTAYCMSLQGSKSFVQKVVELFFR